MFNSINSDTILIINIIVNIIAVIAIPLLTLYTNKKISTANHKFELDKNENKQFVELVSNYLTKTEILHKIILDSNTFSQSNPNSQINNYQNNPDYQLTLEEYLKFKFQIFFYC